MLSEECPGKVDQIGQHPVVCIRPVRGKFKAVAGLFLFRLAVFGVLDGIVAGAVSVLLRQAPWSLTFFREDRLP